MNWIEHMEAAARHFNQEAKVHEDRKDYDLRNAAFKDAAAIQQLIIDIENGMMKTII